MPLVRIDISKTASCERVRDVGDAVYNAMIALVEFTVHSADEILRDCERAGEWTAGEASTLPSPTDARS
jgi:hypothetical protein